MERKPKRPYSEPTNIIKVIIRCCGEKIYSNRGQIDAHVQT